MKKLFSTSQWCSASGDFKGDIFVGLLYMIGVAMSFLIFYHYIFLLYRNSYITNKISIIKMGENEMKLFSYQIVNHLWNIRHSGIQFPSTQNPSKEG